MSDKNRNLSVTNLIHLRNLLHKKPYVSTVNLILNILYSDDTLNIIFDRLARGIEPKSALLGDIHVSHENDYMPDTSWHHSDEFYDNLAKYVKHSNHMWFFEYYSQPFKDLDNTDIKPVSVHYCDVMLRKSVFLLSKLTAKQCTIILLHYFEASDSDGSCDDMVSYVKPLIALASHQITMDKKRHCFDNSYGSCDFMLGELYGWYQGICFDTYTPSKVETVPVYKDQHNWVKNITHPIVKGHTKHRFPAIDKRISADSIQQFLTPLAYMLSIPLHVQVHFQ